VRQEYESVEDLELTGAQHALRRKERYFDTIIGQ
jgi:hypothetical protein